MCHNIPSYKHYDQTAATVAKRVALPVTLIAGLAALTQVVTFAVLVGALSVAAASILLAVAVRVLLNRRALAIHAPQMARAEAWRLAAAREQQRRNNPIRVSSVVPAAIENVAVPQWAAVEVERVEVRRDTT